jgi:hypothetical protein
VEDTSPPVVTLRGAALRVDYLAAATPVDYLAAATPVGGHTLAPCASGAAFEQQPAACWAMARDAADGDVSSSVTVEQEPCASCASCAVRGAFFQPVLNLRTLLEPY